MGFSWSLDGGAEQLFFSKVRNFGLRSAPALFDRFASVLQLFMVLEGASPTMVRYVDDFLFLAPSAHECQQSIDVALATCAKAGFSVQPSKVTPPATQVEFLGIVVDAAKS